MLITDRWLLLFPMKELRFDFSAPALPDVHPPPTARWLHEFMHRRGHQDKVIPPATRLAFLGVICLNAAIFAYAMSTTANSTARLGAAEKILPAGASSSKLKAVERPHLSMASVSPEQITSKSDEISDKEVSPLVQLPPTPMIVELPAPVTEPELSKKAPAESNDTVLVFLNSQPGESPMLQNWKTLKFAAAMAAALSVAPVADAQDAVKPVLDRLDQMDGDIKKSFQNLQMDMKSLQGTVAEHRTEIDAINTKIGDLEASVKQLRDQLEDFRRKLPGEIALFSPVTKEQFEELRSRLNSIEQKLESSSRVALSPANAGKLMLVNLYNEDLVFKINGQTYTVPAGRTMPVENVPAGNVTYEMISPTWGRRANTQTRLAANETLTLTVQ